MLEAGLPTEALVAEVQAMARAAREAGVAIIGGDTKVVEHGKVDRLYITTTGIGQPMPGVSLGAGTARPGDKILLSGPIGDHGITILLARGELDLEADLRSDTRSVLPAGGGVDRRRGHRPSGGCGTRPAAASPPRSTSSRSTAGSACISSRSPSPCATRCAAPASCSASIRCTSPTKASSWPWSAGDQVAAALEALRAVRGGGDAVVIGEVSAEPAGTVLVGTRYGGTRVVDMLVGDPLPRIC